MIYSVGKKITPAFLTDLTDYGSDDTPLAAASQKISSKTDKEKCKTW
jgi:hypothetical protein